MVPSCTVWRGGGALRRLFRESLTHDAIIRANNVANMMNTASKHVATLRSFWTLFATVIIYDENVQNVWTRNDAVIGRNTSVL